MNPKRIMYNLTFNWVFYWVLSLTGCINESQEVTQDEPRSSDEMSGALQGERGDDPHENAGDGIGGGADGYAGDDAGEAENDGVAGVDGQSGGTAAGEIAGSGSEIYSGDVAHEGGDRGEAVAGSSGGEEAPINPERGPGCQAYCDHLTECLVPACPGLDLFFNDEVCDSWCGGARDLQLASFAALSCSDFNDIILTGSEELTSFCSDEGIPDECDQICSDFNECGFAIETQACLRLCRGYEEPMFNCAVGAQTCFDLFDCVDGVEPEDEINYQEICESLCFREFQCVREICADGTLEVDDAFEDGYFETCTQACIDTRPSAEELSSMFNGMCADLVQEIRRDHPLIDERCDNTRDDACTLLCEKASACGALSLSACLAECPEWTDVNLRCIDNTPRDECERMNGCFGDPSGQARCRQICDHLQGCLLEGCPPQIIAPNYSDECTAGCLPEPPSPRLTEEYVAYSCREIRAGVYQDTPGLRPLCDGGQDFRPTADECVDVCRTRLDECTPGSESQCIALCRSLIREEYTCILSEGGSCEAIDACLTP